MRLQKSIQYGAIGYSPKRGGNWHSQTVQRTIEHLDNPGQAGFYKYLDQEQSI